MGGGEKWIKGKIKQDSALASYIVELADGRMWRRHIDHLRRAEERERKPAVIDDTACQGRGK